MDYETLLNKYNKLLKELSYRDLDVCNTCHILIDTDDRNLRNDGYCGDCDKCTCVNHRKTCVECNENTCDDCNEFGTCLCNKILCYDCRNDYCDNCEIMTCDDCENMRNMYYCQYCGIGICDNCNKDQFDDNNKCEDVCNECHYKRCSKCWDHTKFKFLSKKLKNKVITFILCLKITKNKCIPKPLIIEILRYLQHFSIAEEQN